MKNARGVIHTADREGRRKTEVHGSHGDDWKGKACSRIAVAAFSQGR